MAAAVTSFCGSTNCFGARAVGFSWGTWNSATGASSRRGWTFGRLPAAVL